jgi:hypothetical protein
MSNNKHGKKARGGAAAAASKHKAEASVATNSKSTVSRSDLFSHITVMNLNPDRVVGGTPLTNREGISYSSAL